MTDTFENEPTYYGLSQTDIEYWINTEPLFKKTAEYYYQGMALKNSTDVHKTILNTALTIAETLN